jgi:bifunctional DNA-binding transcriptional regulator/antitoxin component of YhaV-PrlF toxin-antitoxin module
MSRRNVSIEEKIERQKEVVAKAKDKYDAVLDELKILMKKKRDIEGKKLLSAFVDSDKSLEEILEFMGSKNKNNAQNDV